MSSEKVDGHLRGVAETLLITLYLRAMESQRPGALIKDDNAVALVSKMNYDFSRIKLLHLSEANKLVLILLASCTAPLPMGTTQTRLTPAPVSTHSPDAGTGNTPQENMPNPASVYCEEQGYTSEIRTAADGSQSGVCIFPDGSECDEWAFFRNECGPAPQVTDTPASATSAYTPELVTPDPSLYEGWLEYVDSNYGFKFRYPPEWTTELDPRNDSTTYQHLLWLKAPSKPVEGVQLNIAFEHIDENYGLQRTGIGAGDLIERGKVLFLGEETARIALSLEGKDMEVMYGHTGAFTRGTMRFAISLDYVGVERLGLPPNLSRSPI